MPQAPKGPPPRRGWTTGPVLGLVVGCLCLIAAVGLAIPAVVVAVVDGAMRDDDGFLTSPNVGLSSPGHAVVSPVFEIESDVTSTNLPHAILGDARVTVRSEALTPVFVGIAPAGAVEAYLGDVARSTVLRIDDDRVVYEVHGGRPPATPPDELDIWVAQDQARGVAAVTWPVEPGDWTLVVMNADGSAPVVAETSLGVEAPVLDWLVPTLFIGAGVALIVGLLLVGLSVRSATRLREPGP